MSPRVDSAKDITIHLSADGTSVEGITPNDLALIERQTELTIVDIDAEIRRITADAAQIHEGIGALIIRSDTDLQSMNKLMNRAKDAVKEAEVVTGPVRSFLHNLHAKACNVGAGAIKLLKEDVKFADGRMKDYARQQKAAADEARRIADAAVAQENARRAKLAADEEAERQRKAAELREAGRIREARELAAEPIALPVAMPQVSVVQQAAPKLAGTAQKWPWTAEVVDAMEIIKAVASGEIPLMYSVRGRGDEPLITINETVLKALGKQRQADLNIRGARSFEEPSYARSRS